MEEKKEWPKNIIWWNKIQEKSLELALSQSDAYLKETVTTAQTIQDRTDKILTILVPSFSALLVYLFSTTSKITDVEPLAALFSGLVILFALSRLYFNLKPYPINVSGDDAESFINNELIKEDDTDNIQYTKIALLACNNNKIRAIANEVYNKERSDRTQIVLKVLFIGLALSPLFALIIHLLYKSYFSPVPCI
ncbi:MAG TPA: hypothetical protein VNX01_06140 [Bacteroidia bacterium]|jgi:hypothetical protein|nr:hypothetical protein [Bacteroidia bacterium]